MAEAILLFKDMEYIEISPPRSLLPFIKCFWEYKSRDADMQHTILPNGYFELFMIFEGQKLVSLLLSGLRTKPFEVEVPRGITVSAVRFALPAAEYLLDREIGSILDANLPLNLGFWDIKQIESLSFADRVAAIGGKLQEIIRQKELDKQKLSLLSTIYSPEMSVREVCELSGWERRKVNRYFNSQFGISLKTFLNIIRLKSSYDSIKEGVLYPGLNYYDQSHYIREVKKYTGESPKILLKNKDDRFLQFSVNKKP